MMKMITMLKLKWWWWWDINGSNNDADDEDGDGDDNSHDNDDNEDDYNEDDDYDDDDDDDDDEDDAYGGSKANSRAGSVAKAKALSLLNGLNPTSRPHKCIQHYTQYFSNTTYIAWSFRWKCKIWPPRIKFPISIIAFVSLWVDSYPSFCLWWLTRIIFKFFCLWWLTNRKLTNSPTFGDSLMRLERHSSLATTPSLNQLPLARRRRWWWWWWW